MNKKMLSLYFLLGTMTQNAMADELLDALDNVKDYLYLGWTNHLYGEFTCCGYPIFYGRQCPKESRSFRRIKNDGAWWLFYCLCRICCGYGVALGGGVINANPTNTF